MIEPNELPPEKPQNIFSRPLQRREILTFILELGIVIAIASGLLYYLLRS